MKALIRILLACVFCVQLSSNYSAQSATFKFHQTSFAAAGTEEFHVSIPAQYSLYSVAANVTRSVKAGVDSSGPNGDGGPATSAQLNQPNGMAVDSAGNLYIIDSGNQRIRKVTPAGIISTIAGNGSFGFSGDSGQASSAQLGNPFGWNS
jgi:hypothetical protein